MNRIRIDNSKAVTPPSLLGTARKIAYAKRKYHSGWMWAGVTRGFAGVKLSGSMNKNGVRRLIEIKIVRISNPLVISFIIKYG
jgi:hypothetical protein